MTFFSDTSLNHQETITFPQMQATTKLELDNTDTRDKQQTNLAKIMITI